MNLATATAGGEAIGGRGTTTLSALHELEDIIYTRLSSGSRCTLAHHTRSESVPPYAPPQVASRQDSQHYRKLKEKLRSKISSSSPRRSPVLTSASPKGPWRGLLQVESIGRYNQFPEQCSGAARERERRGAAEAGNEKISAREFDEIDAVRVRSERRSARVRRGGEGELRSVERGVRRKGEVGRRRNSWKDKARYGEISAVGVRSRGIRVRRRKSTEAENAVETGLEGEAATRCAGDLTSERWARVKKMRRRWAYVVKSVGNVVNDVAWRRNSGGTRADLQIRSAGLALSRMCGGETWVWCKTTKKYSEKEN
ncbi:hypothetical protein R3P38DRAFT_2799210 [Favolaschia claudopus]|uniref:Uncharacterized protein n=1 Tax=Favolaschia claudopus TaxID=2862362 RepID=A0AAW0A083_9AGAR